MLCVQQPHRQRRETFFRAAGVQTLQFFARDSDDENSYLISLFSLLCALLCFVLKYKTKEVTSKWKKKTKNQHSRRGNCIIYQGIIRKPCMNSSSVFVKKKRERTKRTKRAKTKTKQLLTATGSCLSPWAVSTWRWEEHSQWLPSQLESSFSKVESILNTFNRHFWF